jgi:hypothetical protein
MSGPTVERGRYGQWTVYGIAGGFLLVRQYYGYGKREAVQAWRREAARA